MVDVNRLYDDIRKWEAKEAEAKDAAKAARNNLNHFKWELSEVRDEWLADDFEAELRFYDWLKKKEEAEEDDTLEWYLENASKDEIRKLSDIYQDLYIACNKVQEAINGYDKAVENAFALNKLHENPPRGENLEVLATVPDNYLFVEMENVYSHLFKDCADFLDIMVPMYRAGFEYCEKHIEG